MAIVYKHVRLDKNECFYIGIGKNKTRAYSTSDRTDYWKSVAKKGYEVEVLLEDLTWEQACEKERDLIKQYGRKDLGVGPLVNMTDGGQGRLGTIPWIKGKKHSEETICKMSTSHKGKKHSIETKVRMSDVAKGKPGTNTGKLFTQEWKDNISKAKIGYKHKIESKEKMVGLFIATTCPFCNKTGQETAMKRWHFSNCKKKNNE
jgi:hypothetical protein